MPSRIRIGPEGGPYVIVDENNGVLDITTPNDEVDFGNNDLINAALGGILDAKGNDITNVDALNSNSVNTESLVNDRLYAGAFDGADADARLDNALSAASDGDTIYLEATTYTQDRTINHSGVIHGTGGWFDGTAVNADWTLTGQANLFDVEFSNDTDQLTHTGGFSRIDGLHRATITVSADAVLVTGCNNINVIFESDTDRGVVDSCTASSVTDNGTNTVGDIA